jgi:YidC/Oxa1 family membrane protein insertase
MDIRKTLLWAIFTISAILLFDNWQTHNGQSSMFGASKKAETTQEPNKPKQDLPKPIVSTSTASPVAPANQTTVAKAGEIITLKNDVLELNIDTLGGAIVKAKLLKHLEEDKTPVSLFDKSSERQYFARSGLVSATGVELPNHTQVFSVVRNTNNNSVILVAEKNGVRLEKTYALTTGSYLLDAKHVVKNISAQNLDATIYAEIVRDGGKPSFKGKVEDSSFYSTFTGPAIYTDAEKFLKVEFSDIEKGKAKTPGTQMAGQPTWVAMIQHYFTTAWIPSTTYQKDLYVEMLEKNQYRVGVKSKLEPIGVGQEKTESLKLFVGPQEESVLESIAPGLELVKDYGWLTILAKPIFWLLEKIHGIVNNWGWSIILLTVLIKLLFFPLSAASYKSMAKMKLVQPRLMEMKERFKGEPQKLNQAMMEMYRKEKINPLGGCLPVVVQIPVFIALYWVLLASVEMRGAPWLGWIQDLSQPDTLFGVWFGAPIGLLPIIMAISMFIQVKLNPTPPDPLQAKLMMYMPLIFSIMFFFFPSGLVLYWVVNNILSIAQQWQINRVYGDGNKKPA